MDVESLVGTLVSIRDLDLAITSTSTLALATLSADGNGNEQLGYAAFDGMNWRYSIVDGADTAKDEGFKGFSLGLGPADAVHIAAVRLGDGDASAHHYRAEIIAGFSDPVWISSTVLTPSATELHDPRMLFDEQGAPRIVIAQWNSTEEEGGLVLLQSADGTFDEPTSPVMMVPRHFDGAELQIQDYVFVTGDMFVGAGSVHIDELPKPLVFMATYNLQDDHLSFSPFPSDSEEATLSIGGMHFNPTTQMAYFLLVAQYEDEPTTVTVMYSSGEGGGWGNTLVLPADFIPTSFTFTVDDDNQAMIVVQDARDEGNLVYYTGPAYSVPNVTGDVVIVGNLLVGQVLTAETEGLDDPEGFGTFSYQWQADGEDIEGATQRTLTLAPEHVDAKISVIVRYVDPTGTAEEAVSEPSLPVQAQNHLPEMDGVPPQALAIAVGTRASLPSLTVSDDDGLDVVLRVVVKAVNGTLTGLNTQGGIDGFVFSGTASEVNAWLSQGVFQAAAAGPASVIITVDDGTDHAVPFTVNYLASTTVTPPQPPLVDGVPVVVTPGTSPDGTPTHTVTIPVVQPGRPDSNGQSPLADIPLVTTGGTTLLQAQVPAGFGLTVSGPSGTSMGAQSLAQLIREIQAHTAAGSADQNALTGGGTSFLSGLDASSPLLVQTIVTTALPTSGNDRLVINSTPTNDGGVSTALVIDATGLPASLNLQTDGVEFLALIGHIDLLAGADTQNVWGDSGEQTVRLGAGEVTVMTGGGNDIIIGSFAAAGGAPGAAARVADSVPAGEQHSLLHGGADDDVVRYDATSDGFVITRDFAITTVRSLSDPDAVHTLINVESLVFSDRTVEIENDVSLGWIAGLYDQVLGRQADVNGIQYWAHQHEAGMSAGEMALQFLRSAEASLVLDTDTAAARGITVEAFYEGLLGRASDADGKAYWVNELAEGAGLADVAGAFLATVEGQGTALDQTDWNFFV